MIISLTQHALGNFDFNHIIYTFVYKSMQHVAEQAMQQMFGETNLWETRHNTLSTCRIIWHINEWEIWIPFNSIILILKID